MEIETVRTNFTQFSRGLLVRVTDGNSSIRAEIDESDLASFALRLMDVADDCMAKLRNERARKLLADAMAQANRT